MNFYYTHTDESIAKFLKNPSFKNITKHFCHDRSFQKSESKCKQMKQIENYYRNKTLYFAERLHELITNASLKVFIKKVLKNQNYFSAKCC